MDDLIDDSSLNPSKHSEVIPMGPDGPRPDILIKLLVFEIQGTEYAIPLTDLVEVIHYRRPTPLPGAPPALEGMFTLKGRVIYLYNARRVFASPSKGAIT